MNVLTTTFIYGLAWFGGRSLRETTGPSANWELSAKLGAATYLSCAASWFAWHGAALGEGMTRTQAELSSFFVVAICWWWDRELRRASESCAHAVLRALAHALATLSIVATFMAGRAGAPPYWLLDLPGSSPSAWWPFAVALPSAGRLALLLINPIEPAGANRREDAAALAARSRARLRSWKELRASG